MQSILLLRYVKWHFIDAPRNILRGWGNILWFNFNYFSVGLLLQTFFSPWRRITWDYGRGFNLGAYLFTLGSNLISRIIGAIMRSFLVAAGLAAQFAILLIGSFLLLFWFALPALIAVAFAYGIFLLF
ncbi:MAG: hypothetical protein A3J30_02745 [Candidatus Wildermuthbacteria bacterium RIFCSPLOWO2_02_FULL_47_9c]|uniref:Uncharacterized protein n=2 Tax=Parcubacteria group TaxID=1794811 RepID=A0A837ILP0_9BACT|nr:MAG: hypothetical protein UY25_C0002G0103 [Candidatus Yanofskybacteria bacterium GW2011_GWC1_48_11]KKW04648.1 MAG: hypothetical protein UY38_C0001G0215 [Parcubacteria group bacterium GW2011_GWB1_49_12]KKW09051.1 MAG: hypothetical protein UY45_C0002G0103 [Parcubacteria group bacterium GW2011_GWA1_49_26]KKW13636.1 MAG: hypothetical protein UY53_C0010G0045 [Parcubacteria group bacterium GW2011_GWA2_50_10]OHA61100.1 MAG: hypothetical protein A2109_02515 [Candidatus Wildermuthbacteria bacterium G